MKKYSKIVIPILLCLAMVVEPVLGSVNCYADELTLAMEDEELNDDLSELYEEDGFLEKEALAEEDIFLEQEVLTEEDITSEEDILDIVEASDIDNTSDIIASDNDILTEGENEAVISDNSVSDNLISDNCLSENTVSEDFILVSEDSISENELNPLGAPELIPPVGTFKLKKSKDTVSIQTGSKTYSVYNQISFGSSKDNTYSANYISWSSSNTDVATVNKNGVATCKMAGKAVISAKAITASGKDKTLKFTITVKQLATSIKITNPIKNNKVTVRSGKSIKLNTCVYPENTSNKAVSYSITSQSPKVKVSSKGVVSVPKNYQGDIAIKITSKDGGNASTTVYVYACPVGFKSIKAQNKSEVLFTKNNGFGSPVSRTLTFNIASDYNNRAGVNADLFDYTAYTLKSSNESVVSLSNVKATKTAISCTIKAVKAGTATITLAATDGTKKKATCKVTVANPASSVTISSPKNMYGYISIGKTYSLKASVGTDNGKLWKKGVNWSVDGNPTGIKVSKSGVVSASKKASPGTINVRATAKDGSGAYNTYKIIVVHGASSVYMVEGYEHIMETNIIWYNKAGKTLNLGCCGKVAGKHYQIITAGMIVKSSNPKIVDVSYTGNGMATVKFLKKGSCTITIKAKDGSGKSKTYKFESR